MKCFLGAQTRKHLLRKQNVSEQIEKQFSSATDVSWCRKRGNICFRNINIVSSFADASRIVSDTYPHSSKVLYLKTSTTIVQ